MSGFGNHGSSGYTRLRTLTRPVGGVAKWREAGAASSILVVPAPKPRTTAQRRQPCQKTN